MIQVPVGSKVYLRNLGYATLDWCPNDQYVNCYDTSSVYKDDPYAAMQALLS